jgi:3-phenylpropionate/trans-cinnamate dioxygenase ferredoxin subunit
MGAAALGDWCGSRVRWNLVGELGGALMADFVPVAKVTDVPDPGKELVEVGERLVVLIHAAGHWYALDDVCTHDGGPLSEGPLDPAAGTIACPRHGAKFDVKTGAALTMPATKPTKIHQVKIEGDRVLIRLCE